MKLLVFRALWGMTGSLPQQIAQIASAGYDGVECFPLEGVSIPVSELRPLLEQYGLKLIVGGMVSSADQIGTKLDQLAEYLPLKINLHSGRDAMPHDAGSAFFEAALTHTQRLQIEVCHETHRGRLLYTPWDTAFYLRQFPELKITADYSHWVNVCERLPDDQAEALTLANERTIHIHGRVGYPEGPQVPHPAAPEYATESGWHEAHWQQIKAIHQQRKEDWLTFTPEYGPPGYLHTLPFTNAPVADLWEICLWSANRSRQLFNL